MARRLGLDDGVEILKARHIGTSCKTLFAGALMFLDN